ncbi:extracelular serine peptidase [Niveomyces insectorum RCEF 264]|uniref:Extracelular serine peptidase n=1 Tax=Niveomyces insectorum RCEF 264 TaxID=1081102 RepID=A0A162MEZ0_9HYPO|nr:extracelular serine peptidase [Niveomyces insectorum RCEF 264]
MRCSLRTSLATAAGLLALSPAAAGLRTWQPIRELQKQIEQNALATTTTADDRPLYPAYNLSVPIDHFHNDSLYEPHANGYFNLRYWFDASYYTKGGPVIVLAAGETSGSNRLDFLHKGIAAQLAKAAHGLAVVLEHRYYGTSFPVDDLTTESLRFLRTEQALADTAYFAQHVLFPGLEDVDLSPGSGAPWIVYGGSYAGAFAAFLRVLYPDVFWGAISSSGVTEAIYDYWQYYEAQRLYGPPACVEITQKFIHIADQILLAGRDEQVAREQSNHREQYDGKQQQQQLGSWISPGGDTASSRVDLLKSTFGFGNITHDDDFASLLSDAMGGWQGTNWDPAENDPSFAWYCGNATADRLLYPVAPKDGGERKEHQDSNDSQEARVRALLAATSYRDEVDALTVPLQNFIGWVQATHRCPADRTQDACFGSRNATFYQRADLTQHWRSWTYQYCTQWGYLGTGSGVPADQLPLISRLLDLEYLSIVCREAFNITAPPDVASVNKLGGFDIRYPRLAIVDGEADPWRDATPHAIHRRGGARDRKSTTEEPFLLIGGGAVHHWDEYGLLDNETTADLPPAPVRQVQAEEAAFVKAWVAEWAAQNRG